MIVLSILSALLHRSQTYRSNGLPAIWCSGFPGKRVEPQRAGMMTTFRLICHPEPRRRRGTSHVVMGHTNGDSRNLQSGWEVPRFARDDTRVRSCRRKLRQNNLGRFREILRDPVGRTVGGVRFKTGPNANHFDSGIVSAMHVNFFVANHNGTSEIDRVFARALQDHSGRGFAAFRIRTGDIGTNVGCIDQWLA